MREWYQLLALYGHSARAASKDFSNTKNLAEDAAYSRFTLYERRMALPPWRVLEG